MKEIYENIYIITERSRWKMLKAPANIYIIASKKGIIFEGGYGTLADIRFFRKEYIKVLDAIKKKKTAFKAQYLIPSHSHGDHFAGLCGIRKFTGAKVCLTSKMAEVISSGSNLIKQHRISNSPVRILWKEERTKAAGRWDLFFPHLFGLKFLNNPDIIIKENDYIDDGERIWRVMPVKGHCDDHIALFDDKSGILLSGDNVIQNLITWLGPPRSDLEDYCSTLKKIRALKNLKIILPAHGKPLTKPIERIDEILNHRRKKTMLVIDIIASREKKGIHFKELRDIIYPHGTNMWLKSSGEGWILSTIEFLMKKRMIFLKKTKDKTKIMPTDKIFSKNYLNQIIHKLTDSEKEDKICR
ncbi:MAG: hypothetical protein CSA18_03275 [Deltaproteobacteria bacterium]|nr:MAG: hypothetical protein CSA18_03275 [Deltaproteobacteria bacterium]